MDDAAKILILGGVLNLAFGLLTGIPISMIRQNNPTYSKYLRLAHMGGLMWSPILFGLVLAIQLSSMDASVELLAAWLMLIASVTLGLKDILNWRMSIQDEFAERPRLPLLLGGISSLFSVIGTAIILVGVVQGL